MKKKSIYLILVTSFFLLFTAKMYCQDITSQLQTQLEPLFVEKLGNLSEYAYIRNSLKILKFEYTGPGNIYEATGTFKYQDIWTKSSTVRLLFYKEVGEKYIFLSGTTISISNYHKYGVGSHKYFEMATFLGKDTFGLVK